MLHVLANQQDSCEHLQCVIRGSAIQDLFCTCLAHHELESDFTIFLFILLLVEVALSISLSITATVIDVVVVVLLFDPLHRHSHRHSPSALFFDIILLASHCRGRWDKPLSEGGPAPLKFTVHRNSLLQDGWAALHKAGPAVKGRLVVSFVNEQGLLEAGLDYGGLVKEFLEQVLPAYSHNRHISALSAVCLRNVIPIFWGHSCHGYIGYWSNGDLFQFAVVHTEAPQLMFIACFDADLLYIQKHHSSCSLPVLMQTISTGFDANYGLFTSTSDGLAYPQPAATKIPNGLGLLEFLGLVVGKALYEGILLDLPLAPFFVARLQGRRPMFDELSALDPELYRSLVQLKV